MALIFLTIELLLPPGALYTQRKEPKQVALNQNNDGSQGAQPLKQSLALKPNTDGAQNAEYSVSAYENYEDHFVTSMRR
ncbi:hypothetical protein ACFFX0_10045 [Citricoccus parietis]|uniref:Uncharacterized protein n=1 Tax=Citricoccus parietis TaxID=592307 RepID=A0ABV5FXV7_9MICC